MDTTSKAHWLRYGIYAAGLLCAFVFVLVRIRGGAESIIYKQEYFNARDLYKHNFIEHFRESHPAFDRPITGRITPYRETPANPPLAEADILIFGDSFMDFRWLPSFPEILRDRTGRRVHFNKDYYPLRVLGEAGYRDQPRRVLLYEIGEKGLAQGFMKPAMNLNVRSPRPEDRPRVEFLKPGEAEQRYTALLQMSLPTHWFYRKLATLKFNLLGYISPLTPVYTLEPPTLFFHSTTDQSPTSFFYRHSDKQLDLICDNIQRLHDELDRRFNIEMIFLPVPNKITVHHDLVFDHAVYGNLLPRVFAGLDRRGVPFIDLYTPYAAATNMLYFHSDTHWNEHGIDLAVETTRDYLERHGWITP